MHDLRENFFLNGKRRRGKSGEQGTENAGTKEEEEGKATGKRGNSTGMKGTQGNIGYVSGAVYKGKINKEGQRL